MPCDSRITQTKMLEAERLAEALKQLGHDVTTQTETQVFTRGGLNYYRDNKTQGFKTNATDTEKTDEVGMKYGELTARSWAKARGYVVQKFDQETQKMSVIKRKT